MEFYLRQYQYNYIFLKRWLYLILFLLFLTPSMRFIPAVPAIRLEELVLILLLLVLFVNILIGKTVIIAWGLRQTLFLGLFFVVAISILAGSFMGFDTSLADFNQFIRVIKYLLVYTLAVSVYRLSGGDEKELENVLKYILCLSLILSIITIQQYFNLFNLNEKYVQAIAPTQFRTLIEDYPHPRPVGMIGNPNELGFLFAITSWISIYLLIKNKIKFNHILVLSLQVTGLFLTLSRGAFIAFIIGLIILLIGMMRVHSPSVDLGKLRRLFLFLIITSIAMAGVVTSTDFVVQIFWRFLRVFDLASDTSWQGRLNNWNENVELFKNSPLIGVGPLRRADFQFAADNEWLLLLRSYGVIGTLYIVLLFLIPHFISAKRNIRLLSTIILLGSAVYMIPTAVFHSLVLMPIIFIILAMSDDNNKLIKLKF